MSLFRSGTILFIASMIGNLSGYFFQFFMGRYLSIEDYGAMNAVFSLMTVVAIPAGTITLVVAKYISVFKAKEEEGKIAALYRNSLLNMTGVGALFFLPFLIFNAPIASYLKIYNGWPIIIIGVGIFFSFIVTVNLGMLQGLQSFYYLGAGMGLGGFLRLIFGVILILLGFGLNGAVAAPVLSALFIAVLTIIPLSAYLKKREIYGKNTRDILLYSVPVLLSTFAFTIITNIDLIIVKHLFTPEDAGLYAATVILGKTILYLPGALVLVLFPMVSESHVLNGDSFKILEKGLMYTIIISLSGVFGFFLFPELAITMLYGKKFIAAAPLLKFYGLAMMFMAIISILISFNLARHRNDFIYTLVAGCIVLAVLLHFFHNSLSTVIFIITAVNLCLVAVNLWMVYQDRKEFYRIRKIEIEDVKAV